MNKYYIRFKVLAKLNEYEYRVCTKRKSGIEDYLILQTNLSLTEGKNYQTEEASICSINYYDKNKQRRRLKVCINSDDIQETNEPNDTNEGKIDGYVCKVSKPRTTPLGRTITEFVIAHNPEFEKGYSVYLPCIYFGRAMFKQGEKIKLYGKLQSRDYINSMGESGRTYEFVTIHIANVE